MPNQLLLRISDVCQSVGLSKATIYKQISEGRFPRPLNISTRAVAWHRDDIQSWVENLTKNAHKQEGQL